MLFNATRVCVAYWELACGLSPVLSLADWLAAKELPFLVSYHVKANVACHLVSRPGCLANDDPLPTTLIPPEVRLVSAFF